MRRQPSSHRHPHAAPSPCLAPSHVSLNPVHRLLLLQLHSFLRRRLVHTSCPIPLSKLFQDPPQGTPTHKRISSPAASPGLGVILAPGPKKRKRRIGGYQPGLLGFDDNQRNSTSDPADPNPDLPTRKRPRLSIDGARRLPAPAENVCIRGLASLKKAVYNDIGTGAPKTGPKVSKKENEAKELRNKSQNKVAAPAKLRRSYLPPCEGPEEVDAVITPTDINNILRTETSGNEAGETCLDIEVDMSGDPPPRGCSPTPVQHLQTPRTPPPAREESHKPSQRTESTQEVINVFDFELNLLCDEENDVDHQLALQLDCEMNSSPTHPTVCAPSVIEPDDAVDFNPSPSRVYPSNLPYGGVPGVGGSWECHDLAPFATEAVTFTGEYLHGPSIKMSDICDTKLAGVSRPHEKGDNEEFIERDLEPSPWSSEGTPDGAGVVPESPEVERQSTPEERLITQAAVTSSTGISGSGSSQLNTTPEAFATVDSDMKASDEGVGANHRPSLLATRPEPQEPILPQIPTSRGIHISIIGSECAHQEATAPSKCTVPTSRTTQLQSSSKFTRTAIEGLESLMLKRLNLTPKALAPPNPPVWEVSDPSTCAGWILRKAPFTGSCSFALQKTLPQR